MNTYNSKKAQTSEFIDHVYEIKDLTKTPELYDEWATVYNDDMQALGYVTPLRIANMVNEIIENKDIEIHDFGCGTGIAGQALKLKGFHRISGSDVTKNMIDHAHALGLYEKLILKARPSETNPLDSTQPSEITPKYDVIVACGVIGVGAAPVSVFDDIFKELNLHGHFFLSFNSKTLELPEFEAKVLEYSDTGYMSILKREEGTHMMNIENSISVIYALRKDRE